MKNILLLLFLAFVGLISLTQCMSSRPPRFKLRSASDRLSHPIINNGVYLCSDRSASVFYWMKFYPDGFCRVGGFRQGIFEISGDTIRIDLYTPYGKDFTGIDYLTLQIIDSLTLRYNAGGRENLNVTYHYLDLKGYEVWGKDDFLHKQPLCD